MTVSTILQKQKLKIYIQLTDVWGEQPEQRSQQELATITQCHKMVKWGQE